MAQHVVRLVVFRDRFLERYSRDGLDGCWVPPGIRTGYVCVGSRSAPRYRQNDIRLFNLLDVYGVRSVFGDLVRRYSDRNVLYRPTFLACPMDLSILVHADSDMGSSVPGVAGRPAQAHSRDPGNRLGAWSNWGMDSQFYPGGAFALARPFTVRLGRADDHGWIPWHFSALRNASQRKGRICTASNQ